LIQAPRVRFRSNERLVPGGSVVRSQTRSLMALESTLVYRWIDRDVYQKSTGRVTTPA
jgi:hypothetical protein